MNRLDVQLVNSQSPYKVEEADDENFFEFFTEHDVHYSVGFMPDDSLMQSEAYHLIIVNVDNRPSPSDRKVKDTVLAVVAEFFDKNNTTLLYICDTGDGKQRLRSRLFERWFSAYTFPAGQEIHHGVAAVPASPLGHHLQLCGVLHLRYGEARR